MAAFYADENVPLRLVETLRAAGHDVLRAIEDGRAVIRYDKRHETFVKMLDRNGKKDVVRDALTEIVGGPLGVQFGIWFTNVLHGDLGESFFFKKTVSALIAQRLEPTIALALCTIILAVIDRKLIPDTLHTAPHDLFGLNFTSSEISFGIFGFLLVVMMLARPEGLIPERRRKLER